MSASPAEKLSPAQIGDSSDTKNATPSRPMRQRSFVLAVAFALAVAACAGGVSLDIPIGPVNHDCHYGERINLGGDGSGCSG